MGGPVILRARAQKPRHEAQRETRREAQREARHEGARETSYVLEGQVGHLLRRAHQRHAALFQAMFADALGAEAALTPMQWALLVKLDTLGEATQNALGRLTAMDPATTQGVVRRLIARGLVTRAADPADKRTLKLTVTPAGRAAVAGALPVAAAISEATLSPLSADERTLFLDLLQRMAFA
ncbi:MarR family winged helix-turn-helix transcriptional regulator [Elioraea sp.]|uniref:MarR family winged helix-turn-helix transcriptional regulator n=1 Tax=Elioraea sp. TaxID=2185103 RepID=UPI0025BBEFFF|nr:MarR family transcriptional regulator [Elioraea sp.]